MSGIRRFTSLNAGRAKSQSVPRFSYFLQLIGAFTIGILALTATQSQCRAEETNTQTGAVAKPDETNSLETLRAYLQLQEQLHLTQLAIEQNRKEAKDTAAQSAQALADRLEAIEKALSAQRARELDAMQSSNRVMLTVAGTFAAVGFAAMLLMAYFQWRTVHGLAEVSSAIPNRALGAAPTVAALGPGDTALLASGPASQSNVRLLGTLQRLERRIDELEHAPHAALNPGASADEQSGLGENGHPSGAAEGGSPSRNEQAEAERAGPLKLLLGKGQSMLSLDKAEAALACFNEVLAMEPANTEALIKKGIALERLHKLDEAIDCYDRAITADGSMTIAYLHKGGLFNRMERFNEALECYEQALRTQEKRHA